MDIQAQAPDDYSGSLYLPCPKFLQEASMTSLFYVRRAIHRQTELDRNDLTELSNG